MTISNQDVFDTLKYDIRVDEFGNKFYRNKDGRIHRLDGPAVEFASGTKWWYINGERHRLDGPAIEWPDGHRWWYLNDELYTEKEFNIKIKELKSK